MDPEASKMQAVESWSRVYERSRFKCLPCEGTYFQTVDYSQISTENDVDFCVWLIKEHGVAAIPLSVFYESKKDLNHIRLCFAKDHETLTNALVKLCKI